MRRALALTFVVGIAACTAPTSSVTSSSTVPTITATSTPATEPSIAAVTTTLARETSTTSPAPEGPGPRGVATYLPDDPTGAAVAVLVHGGGWIGGSPASIASLAEALAQRGMLVFNSSYRTALVEGAYPGMFDDVACAVRFARNRAAELGASESVTLIGHSAGAHLASVVAFSGDGFGGDCPWEGTSTPEGVVGLAGLYRIDSVAPLMEALLGGDRETAAEAWAAVDPFEHLAAATGVAVTLIHGATDDVVPPFSSRDLAGSLEGAGVAVGLQILEGADHMDVIDPAVTADLIAALVP